MVKRLCCLGVVAVLALAVIGCDPPPTCATSMPARLTNVGTAPTNVFKLAIGSNPALLSNSAAIISRQVNSGRYAGANTEVLCGYNEWYAPVFYTDATQTKNTYIPLHLDGNPSYGGITQAGPMRWKSCISGGQSTDGPSYVIDTVDRCFYEFWMLNRNALIADPEAGWLGGLPLDDATQVWEPYEGLGGTAGAVLGYSSIVWPDEITTGVNHGFSFGLDWAVNNPDYHVWPVYHADGSGTHADDMRQGMRVQLSPSYDISGLPTYKRAIAQAMKDYGMIDMNSTVGTWAIGGPNPQGYTNNCWNGVLPSAEISAGGFHVVPIAQFRVLQYPYVTTGQLEIKSNSCISYYPTPGTAPIVTTLSPSSAAAGTTVSLTGTDMSNAVSVRFGDTEATNVNAVSATLVTCTVPAGSGSVKVSYRTTTGASNLKDFTYSGGGSAPTLSSINPNNGTTAGGTACTLTGTNLTGTSSVSFGGSAATGIVVDSSSQVRCTSPAKSAGAISVTATTSYGTSNGVTYTYNAPASPTLSAINPSSGTTSGGTACTLTGTGLTGCSAVSFGGTAATGIVVDSSTQVRCTSPAKTAGTISVTATNANGTSNGVNYTYSGGGTSYTTTLNAAADCSVYSEAAGTNQNGARCNLQKNAAVDRRFFVRFSLTGVSGTIITSAKFRWNHWAASSGYTIKAYSCPTDSWVETTITWNNKPAIGSQQATTTLGSEVGYSEWNVTSYVNSEFAGDKNVTLCMLDDLSQNKNLQFYDKEAGASTQPQLVVISQ